MKCTIVIATYNRKELFERTLACVGKADYTGYENINLIISIDRASNYNEMKAIADGFIWNYGKKVVILHKERKGLREHFIFCGSLSQKYGPIIFLEDDVVVNSYFYKSAMKLTEKYIDDDRIVGASLYSLSFNETAQRPFQPIEDGNDVFFCSIMSWAPVYFPRQWNSFLDWLNEIRGREIVYKNIPPDVIKWPKSSFKKLHIQYTQQMEKYFVYTRHSCATNFSEPGEHYKKGTNKLQVSMEMGERDRLQLCSFDESLAVYDAFLELKPSVLFRYNSSLTPYNLTVDLYGMKTIDNVMTPYILTTKKAKSSILTFGRKMIPHELNVIIDIHGNEIVLTKTEDVKFGSRGLKKYVSDLLYDIKGSSVLKILISDALWFKDFIISRIR